MLQDINQYTRTYKSTLGDIELNIFSPDYNIVATDVKIGKVHQIRLKYKDGEIKIREFTLPNQIHNGDKIDNSIGWAISSVRLKNKESS